ncbi:MBL fold metallo-hydrolase [Catenovulum sediminis]|uniref:MBL fold metallo-hydrolase n=1 Tax=Catenovulum sediminis TaxID=1740262 RepID=UPI00117CA4FD|nr:MBL fold metallo-hydrolase [Catenovulum sediminis]
MSTPVYLRPDVYFEPLFNQWYMWPYLLAPAPAAMNLANHHTRLMQSFIANAKLHAQAAKLKSMVGSSIVNCDEQQVEAMLSLLEQSQNQLSDLYEFAKSLKQLDQLLLAEANGESLEGLYEKIPDNLKGYVELVYDLNNQVSYRLIEGLLYLSPLFKKSKQTLCFGDLASDKRPFVLSTPRLADANHCQITVPFSHAFCQALFKMREVPMSLAALNKLLPDDCDFRGGKKFSELFTQQAPPIRAPYSDEGVRVEYIGHAGVLIESKDICCVIDPVLAYQNDEDNRQKFTFADLPAVVDYVMITHTHMDHLCIETLLQIKHKVKAILVPKNNGGVWPILQ